MSDVLAGETGDEIKHTLGTISSVAAALGGLNSKTSCSAWAAARA